VKLEAASLNRSDLSLRSGGYRIEAKDLPVIPGREFAGRVSSLGSGVKGFLIGQRVVALPGKGGYAEYALSTPELTWLVPDGVEAMVAAAMPSIFLTSWFALFEEGAIKAGDQVLIQAGLLFLSLVTGILRTIKRTMIDRKLGAIPKLDLEVIDRHLRRSLGL